MRTGKRQPLASTCLCRRNRQGTRIFCSICRISTCQEERACRKTIRVCHQQSALCHQREVNLAPTSAAYSPACISSDMPPYTAVRLHASSSLSALYLADMQHQDYKLLVVIVVSRGA